MMLLETFVVTAFVLLMSPVVLWAVWQHRRFTWRTCNRANINGGTSHNCNRKEK